jgi:hypothetical protein
LIFGFVTQLKVSINAADVNPMPGHILKLGISSAYQSSPNPPDMIAETLAYQMTQRPIGT